MESPATAAVFWKRQARRLGDRLWWGWAWTLFTPFWLGLSFLAAVGMLILRSQGIEVGGFVAAWGALTAGTGLWALRLARQRCPPDRELFGRVDEALGLENRLCSAAEGVLPWPEPRPTRPPLAWRGRTFWVPLLLGAALLSLGAVLPPASSVPPPMNPTRPEPPEWREMGMLAKELGQQPWADPESLERIGQRLESLRATPPESWFRPGSLEATAEIRRRVREDSLQVREALRQTARLLESQPALSLEGEEARLREELHALLGGMRAEHVSVKEELLGRMGSLAPVRDAPMDPETLREWADLGARAAESIDQALLAAGLLESPGTDPGGVGRGGDTAGLSFGEPAVPLEPARPLGLQNPHSEHAALGEKLAEREGTHERIESPLGQVAGTLVTGGGEGEVVDRSDHLPSEQAVLREYFK